MSVQEKMTDLELVNFIADVVKDIERIMFPVLNRTMGRSFHHEMNAIQVFPGMPTIHNISHIDHMTATSQMVQITGIRDVNINIVDPTIEPNGMSVRFKIESALTEEVTLYIPRLIIEKDNKKDIVNVLLSTYINNINEALDLEGEAANQYKKRIMQGQRVEEQIRKRINNKFL